MLCDKCKKNEACVHVSRNINGVAYEQHLCSECAGVPNGFFMGFGNMDSIFHSLRDMSMIHAALPGSGRVEPTQNVDFNALGLELPTEVPCEAVETEKPASIGENDLKSLKTELEKAVAKQEFERAAELRDKIYFLEKEKGKGKEHE